VRGHGKNRDLTSGGLLLSFAISSASKDISVSCLIRATHQARSRKSAFYKAQCLLLEVLLEGLLLEAVFHYDQVWPCCLCNFDHPRTVFLERDSVIFW
jgi:hypothetical protein